MTKLAAILFLAAVVTAVCGFGLHLGVWTAVARAMFFVCLVAFAATSLAAMTEEPRPNV